jgi:tetratricopeptide (TPR) repeat protein
MDRLTGRTAARTVFTLLLLLAIMAGCQSDSDEPEMAVSNEAAAAPIAAPVSPDAMPLELHPGESCQSDSQQDTGWPQLPSAPTGDQRNATPTQWGSTALNQQTELPPTVDTSNPCYPADSAPSTERVFAVNNADAPRVDKGRDRAIVPADAVSAPEAVGDDTNAPALLPWGPSTPSPELDAVNQRAEQTVRWAFNRAERGALYSARAQFAEALRSIAEALDVQRNTAAHTRALSAGLRALDEVNDFVARDVRSQADMNLRLVVDAHHTPVLKNRSLEGVTLATAQRMYLTYAQEQLAAAGGDQSVSSLALYGMGKVCTAPAALHGPRGKLDEGKAVVFYQSALIVDTQNFMAANELGVLLTKFGRWDDARNALEHAVAASGTPTSWRNLAMVCDRMGDQPKAVAARHQADLAVAQLQKAGHKTPDSKYAIEMVDSETFAQMHTAVTDATGENTVARPAATAAQQPAVSTAAKPSEKGGFWPWSRK